MVTHFCLYSTYHSTALVASFRTAMTVTYNYQIHADRILNPLPTSMAESWETTYNENDYGCLGNH